MKLKHVPGRFGVAQLPADAAVPGWLDPQGFSAIIRSDDELTIVCKEERIPDSVPSELGWACFRSVGPFGFDETGIVAALVSPISAADIGVFVVCTYDGEHVLYPMDMQRNVVELLTRNGHSFIN